MASVSLKQVQDALESLAQRVEQGETIVVTRNGLPVFDLTPHRKTGGVNLARLAEYKAKHGIDKVFLDVADDFDDPLPEDFLLRPLP